MPPEDRRDYSSLEASIRDQFETSRRERREDNAVIFKKLEDSNKAFTDHLLDEAEKKADHDKKDAERDSLINKHEDALESVKYFGWKGITVLFLAATSFLLHFLKKPWRDTVKDFMDWFR